MEIEEFRSKTAAFDNGHVQNSTCRERFEAAIRHFHLAPEFAGRATAADIDDPTNRVASEQCSLRTAENFDLFNIEKVEELTGRSTDEDTIDNNTHSRFLRLFNVRIGQTADRKVGRSSPGILVCDKQVRRCAGQIADIDGVFVFNHRGIDRGQRNRRILQRFITATCGNDDFAAICLIRTLGVLRKSGCRKCQQAGAGEREASAP